MVVIAAAMGPLHVAGGIKRLGFYLDEHNQWCTYEKKVGALRFVSGPLLSKLKYPAVEVFQCLTLCQAEASSYRPCGRGST